eukprot:CAMPEP_0118697340 /NCGR_PEP_ID=MMETSP0800-20121206/14435_1 /TAXON_ID=210618 ORGANISM="Striatella unipunctata, Strain CCMP2910" /NCGR_SAMPLE_ID=MMETSP0800 /ASSEMBLY_ACC=CAM_ASM_000638 /LENGTH=198 /DNA_ID=CAMNT_0006596727 /DNA_START=82 /DNA_END=678 /DNA_ORIENTATION=-
MALISSSSKKLQLLTWVDPLTVDEFDGTKFNAAPPALQPQQPNKKAQNAPNSHIHGTNGYMVPIPDSDNELLGIAHFHRPHKRTTSKYALHGHHYTHAFYTIKEDSNGRYQLTRLSNEFVFRSQSPSLHSGDVVVDADIIQFASGLDIVGGGKHVLISYGINDCEGAAFFVGLDRVLALLGDYLPNDKQVVDFMATIK